MACSHGCFARKPQQRSTAAKSSTSLYVVCVCVVLRSKCPSSTGRRGRVADCLFGVWLLWLWATRAAHSSQNVFCSATIVRERPAAPRDKPTRGMIGWCNDAKYVCHIYCRSNLEHVVSSPMPRGLGPDIA